MHRLVLNKFPVGLACSDDDICVRATSKALAQLRLRERSPSPGDEWRVDGGAEERDVGHHQALHGGQNDGNPEALQR